MTTDATPPDVKPADAKVPDAKLPGVKLPDVKSPDVKLPDVKLPDPKLPDAKTPDPKSRDSKTDQVERQIQRMTRRSFATGATAALAGLAGWGWLRTRPDDEGIQWPLRHMLQWNQRLAEAYFRPTRLSPNFPQSIARMPRANGLVGLAGQFDPATWSLHVENSTGQKPLKLTLDDVKSLPRIEMVTELRCIEGWSDPVHWTGARLVDLAAQFGIATRAGGKLNLNRAAADLFRYVKLSTPDSAYYVGLDVESALHPQTLLCYEMNGEPLTPQHGAPLRLAIPVKYGIKNLKRIGTILFTDERPADYWAERGYDWYAGH
jgi:DMSO/TMAO reductase YedYZ molybdopterin-dependent catalytic subunit